MSRIVLVTDPQSMPNQCVICGTSVIGKGFIDINFFAEFYGTPYFCETCVKEMGSYFGLHTNEELIAEMIRIRAINTALTIRLGEVTMAIKELLNLSSSEVVAGTKSMVGTRVSAAEG